MSDEERIDPSHGTVRGLLRIIGPMIALVGVGFAATGLISFFSVFSAVGHGGFPGFPDKFWCAFVGLPLIGLGVGICKFAYMGAVTRYVAGEIAPPAADTFNYLAEETQEGIAAVAEAIGNGTHHRESQAVETAVACAQCGERNDPDAWFCKECGAPLTRKCPYCEGTNDADAKFCDKCGKALG